MPKKLPDIQYWFDGSKEDFQVAKSLFNLSHVCLKTVIF